VRGSGPFVATAIHNGHIIREELLKKMYIDEADRLREEDPFTENWTQIANTRVIGMRSRFEVDLNRPRGKAIYINPEDAWNLKIWNTKPSEEEIKVSLAEYDDFYNEMYAMFSDLKNQYGYFVVFDLHSYNHMRNGPDNPPADPDLNPEVNVGTGTMNRTLWASVVDAFIDKFRNFDFMGRKLDVRENVRFRGGNFPSWIHQNFPDSGCALAVEVKKIFMNEWTGEPDLEKVELITEALRSTIPEVHNALKRM
jgi:N-formylglutamate amidohydrolase